MALVFIRQDALDAELRATLVAEGLYGLHVSDVLIAVLSNDPELVN